MIFKKSRQPQGQTTTEFLLVMAGIAAVALLIGVAFKGYIPNFVGGLADLFCGVGATGGGSASEDGAQDSGSESLNDSGGSKKGKGGFFSGLASMIGLGGGGSGGGGNTASSDGGKNPYAKNSGGSGGGSGSNSKGGGGSGGSGDGGNKPASWMQLLTKDGYQSVNTGSGYANSMGYCSGGPCQKVELDYRYSSQAKAVDKANSIGGMGAHATKNDDGTWGVALGK